MSLHERVVVCSHEFHILCLQGSVIWFISSSKEVILTQFRLYVSLIHSFLPLVYPINWAKRCVSYDSIGWEWILFYGQRRFLYNHANIATEGSSKSDSYLPFSRIIILWCAVGLHRPYHCISQAWTVLSTVDYICTAIFRATTEQNELSGSSPKQMGIDEDLVSSKTLTAYYGNISTGETMQLPSKYKTSCITFVQRRPSVFGVEPTLYKWFTHVLRLLDEISSWRIVAI